MSAAGRSTQAYFGARGALGNWYDWQLTPTFPVGNYQIFVAAANLGSPNSIANGADVPFPSTPALGAASPP